jgi:hypothetical protein
MPKTKTGLALRTATSPITNGFTPRWSENAPATAEGNALMARFLAPALASPVTVTTTAAGVLAMVAGLLLIGLWIRSRA